MIKSKYLVQQFSNKIKKIIFILFFLTLCSTVFADSKMDLGLEVYSNKAQCGVCHTLQAAGSFGDIGPNLDQMNFQMSQIIYAVTNGIGVMPAYEGILTSEEIEAVSFYVSEKSN